MGSVPTSGITTPMPNPQLANLDDYFSLPVSQSPSGTASPMLIPQEHTLHLREQLQKLSFERMSQVPSYEEAIHSDTPNSPDLEFAPEYEPEDHCSLGDFAQGITITPSRRRHTDNHGIRPAPLNEAHVHHPVHDHHHDMHSYHHHVSRPSPLRSVASTTNLLNSHKQQLQHAHHHQYEPHSHSPLGGKPTTSASTSNLSKLMGMKGLITRNGSHVSLKK